jgi:hypothetical protein
VIGDGEEASLTAYMLARNQIIQEYNYKVFLIMGGRGVQKQSKDADENLKSGFTWMPLKGLKFTLNFVFNDSFRSKIIERHMFSFLKYRFIPGQQ